MLPLRKILIVAVSLVFSSVTFAQHPNRKKIDSLKNLLPSAQGINRVNCLNALSEEYWWPPHVLPDSISCWAVIAQNESSKINYSLGLATSTMHLGVAETFSKNFLAGEKYLRQALPMFENIHSDWGVGWCNLWLGQTLYSENNFSEAIVFLLGSLSFLTKLNDYEGEGKAWAWLCFVYAATGNYDSSFYYSARSLQVRQKMSDTVCVAAALANIGHLYKTASDFEDAMDYYRQAMEYANTNNINYYAAHWNYFDEPIGGLYQLMNNPDSSLYYLQKAIIIDPQNQMTRISLGETFLLKKQYDSALNIFLSPIEKFRKGNDQWDLMRVLLDAAKAYEGKRNETSTLQYASEGLLLAQKANLKPYMIQGYFLLSKAYKQVQKNDSAYFCIAAIRSIKRFFNK